MQTAAAEFIVKRAAELDQRDAGWRTHMADIAEVLRPLRKELRGQSGVEGDKRMSKVFDGTGIMAAQSLASGLFGTASNPAETWFKLGLVDKERAKWGPIRDWLSRQSQKLLSSFGPTYSAYYAQVPTTLLDLASFGIGIFSSELKKDHSGFIDLARSPSTYNFDVDAEGRANVMYAREHVPADKLAAEFGKENLSNKVQELCTQGKTDKVEIIRAVLPNSEYAAGMLGVKGKPFISIVVEVEAKHEIQKEGFWDFPYFVVPWEIAEGERKGRGPGEMALPDTKSLNVMARSNLEAGEMAGKPPLGAPSEGNISVVRWAPGKVTYGAVNNRGDQLLRPLMTSGQPPFSLEMQKQLQASVKDFFFFSLMELAGRTGIADLEMLSRNEERLRLMGPYLGRIQFYFHAPLIMRRWRLLQMVPGVIDPPPPDLKGQIIEPEFVSAAALAQKSARGAGVMRLYAAAGPILAADPTAAARLNGDKALKMVGDAFGVPEVLNDDDTTKKNVETIQQMLQAQQAAQIVPPLADAANKGAQAAATAKGTKAAA